MSSVFGNLARFLSFDGANLRTFRGIFAKKGAFGCKFNRFYDKNLSFSPQNALLFGGHPQKFLTIKTKNKI